MSTTTTKSTQKKAEVEALAQLRKLGGELFKEEDIIFEGTKLIVPEKMSLKDLEKYIQLKMAEEAETAEWHRTYRFRPWDGAAALERAFRDTFGQLIHTGVKSLFGKEPPQFVEIEVGFREYQTIPWGVMKLGFMPDVEFELGATRDPEYGLLFQLHASGPKRRRYEVEGIFQLVDAELNRQSLYRGKAFDGAQKPGFIDLERVTKDKVVYAEDVFTQLEASVWTPIRWARELRSAGVQLKSAVLLHGTFGVGKTLAAYLTAQECVANGWTFILVRPGQDDFNEAIQTARLYEPAVVFIEDLDTIASAEQEQDRISHLLDVFDGVRSKGAEVMVVLTTNYPEKIHKGMVRPGRLDAVIEITAPDREGIIRLCKTLTPEHLLDSSIPDETYTDPETKETVWGWDAVAEAMDSYLPAFVREACDRAVKYALARVHGKVDEILITGEDLMNAGRGLRPQFDLMQDAKTAPEKIYLSEALQDTVRPVVEKALEAWG